jgi:hypothetical protein
MKVSKRAMKGISMRLGPSENQLQAASFVSGLIDLLSRERRQDICNPKKNLKFFSLILFDG